ncbi:AAA domain-containing protein, putative AbiEii toxin, Type IV TA system [Methylobacterium sp. 275MFSha3.1]|uniref:AAA family ATPase n=1 Tax=Methylobacterium sp. 275MFSha3.1 TaxID=1502746 RepID=UPI0008A7EF0F|nr:AAA family ATPase [Methylobacterium sp. 275MFSha3.1]SEH31544.1 AAA domain-containing protein, putative AbiEii toxin, Type IV TA system [Methylobacterium sp. 275MFSha3.1]
MYLTNLVIINNGAISRLELEPQIKEDGSPKPIVLVGTNGSGKTSVLSTIADALVEYASLHYQRVTPLEGAGHKYFKVLGGRSIKEGCNHIVELARFSSGENHIYYKAKAGNIEPAALGLDAATFGPALIWPPSGNTKEVVGDPGGVATNIESGTYIYFPSSRNEIPHWINSEILEDDPDQDLQVRFSTRLKNPLVVTSALQRLKPWIVDLLLDGSFDLNTILSLQGAAMPAEFLQSKIASNITLQTLNNLLRTIMRDPEVFIARTNRASGDRRLAVGKQGAVHIPTLDNLSTGQSTLLSIFGSILAHSETRRIDINPQDISGIILIDEVDAHLHAELQYEVLPSLIATFPRIQFIMTSHAPLFPLGMERQFGKDGFQLIEMPTGVTIEAERFREFEDSYNYFAQTKSFEADIRSKLSAAARPIVLCEGETDPLYIRTAAELLGYTDLVTNVDFEYIGVRTGRGSVGSGKDNLTAAFNFLRNNPQFVKSKTVLLYDRDAKKLNESFGDIHVRSLPKNYSNTERSDGIENMLPAGAIDEIFYRQRVIDKGGDTTTIRSLDKAALAEHLCTVTRDKNNFEFFRSTLQDLRGLLL